MPKMNKCWFARRVVDVRRKYALTIDRREADALEGVLSRCASTEMVFAEGVPASAPPASASGLPLHARRGWGGV